MFLKKRRRRSHWTTSVASAERPSFSLPGGEEKFLEAQLTTLPCVGPALCGFQSLQTHRLPRLLLGPEQVSPPVLGTPSRAWVRSLPKSLSKAGQVLPVGQPQPHAAPPSSRVTIRSMQLLFRRLNSESLLCTLEEEGVWTLLESSSTFLQGVSQLARWVPGSPGLHRLAGRSGPGG